jgi:hypothetical protein
MDWLLVLLDDPDEDIRSMAYVLIRVAAIRPYNRKGGGIYRAPWPLIAPAAAMEAACDQLLACAAGTLNEYLRIARTKPKRNNSLSCWVF